MPDTAADLLTRHGIKLESTAPGRHYTTCPKCSPTRKLANQTKKTLGVTINGEGAHWGCNHCGWTGPEKGSGNGHSGDNLISYNYEDASGVVVFQKVRGRDKSGKKFFWLRHPDGHGGWINGTKGVDTSLIYRLPEVIEAMALDRTILVVEGEKDVDRLWSHGIPATCNPHGAPDVIQNPHPKPKWKPEHSEQLRGADLVFVPDNDPAGRYHADTAAGLSRGIAKRIRLLDLAKHWSAIPHGGDVSDYLDAGHGREQLDALIENAPDWSPEQNTADCLAMLDVSAWDGVPVPAREWAVRDRIIRRAVTLLSGEGGIGKSILILQLACAHVLARDWFGQLAEPGSVIYANAEDDERELHFRLEAIRAHLRISFAALSDLHLLPLAGEDALLGVPDRGGIIRSTPLFERLLRTAAKIQPVLIALDTAADCFGGNENDRSQVRQFISLLRRLAITGNSAVLLASHPSLTGINSDSGLSGSTGWHNSVRSRLFFKASASEDDARSDQRELIVRKNNYGPTGEIVRMVWRAGVFVPVASPSSVERAVAEQKIERLFLDLLDRHNRQDQPVSPRPTSPNNYAPAVFAKHREAKGTGKAAFEEAMQRLLDAGTIRIEISGPPSKQRARLVRT